MGNDQLSYRGRAAQDLVLGSFSALFLELAFIRWLPAQVRVIAYFPNLILIASFLGLGVGGLRVGRRNLFGVFPAVLLITVFVAAALGQVIFTQNRGSEYMFLLYYDLPRDAPVVNDIRPPIVLLFALVAVTFVPLGQFIGERLQAFRERGRPLVGYALNLLGSFAGVLAFALASFGGSFPVTWFALASLVSMWLARGNRRRLSLQAVASVVALIVIQQAERADIYSPYYALRMRADPTGGGFVLLANGAYHQRALPMARSDPPVQSEYPIREGYDWAYDRLPGGARDALVIGAGSGNDVAVLLDYGVTDIDAVEIDAEILELGRRFHPDRPYDSPAVHRVVADARSFLAQGSSRYDLIIFGTLDSMTRLSALSSARLDTFVYTVESLRAARRRLSERGGLLLYFRVAQKFIDLRLRAMLTEAFGQVPYVLSGEYGLFNTVYLAGPAFAFLNGEQRTEAAPAFLRAAHAGLDIPTDDWPFLYLESRGVSGFYLSLVVLLGVLSTTAVLVASPEVRSGFREIQYGDGVMFLFGFAFLLLEARAVTEMNLLWAATWLTSAVVFGSILATLLLATIATDRMQPRFAGCFAALVSSLAAIYLLPVHTLAGTGTSLKLFVSVLFVGTPILFAGICFAIIFQGRKEAGRAFGWNLVGAVAGGLAELGSMAIGLKALVLVALLAYLLALLLYLREGESIASPPL